jgi:hypothetical protein
MAGQAHGNTIEEIFWTQIAQIIWILKKLSCLDRLKKWEPVKRKNEQAYFCAPGLPILPKAQPWDPRVAGFPAILASNPVHPVNPVRSYCPCVCG